MTILCTLLTVAVISLVARDIWRERAHRVIVADLLDRVMARSYGEYVASAKVAVTRPTRRRVPTDEEMAALEETLAAGRA